MPTLDQLYQQIGRQYVLNFVAIGSGLGRLKPKKCKKGWECGYSCQSMDKKNCPSALGGQAKTYADWLSKQSIKQVDIKDSTGYSKGSSESSDRGKQMSTQTLTELKGTEKQVKWAEQIRAGKIKEVGSLMEDLKWFDSDAASKIVNYLGNVKDASFWINNRDVNSMGVMIFASREAEVHPWKDSNGASATVLGFTAVDGKRDYFNTEVAGFRFPKAPSLKQLQEKVWLDTDIDTGKFKPVLGNRPEDTNNNYVSSIFKHLEPGALSNDPSFFAVRYIRGVFKVYALVPPKNA